MTTANIIGSSAPGIDQEHVSGSSEPTPPYPLQPTAIQAHSIRPRTNENYSAMAAASNTLQSLHLLRIVSMEPPTVSSDHSWSDLGAIIDPVTQCTLDDMWQSKHQPIFALAKTAIADGQTRTQTQADSAALSRFLSAQSMVEWITASYTQGKTYCIDPTTGAAVESVTLSILNRIDHQQDFQCEVALNKGPVQSLPPLARLIIAQAVGDPADSLRQDTLLTIFALLYLYGETAVFSDFKTHEDTLGFYRTLPREQAIAQDIHDQLNGHSHEKEYDHYKRTLATDVADRLCQYQPLDQWAQLLDYRHHVLALVNAFFERFDSKVRAGDEKPVALSSTAAETSAAIASPSTIAPMPPLATPNPLASVQIYLMDIDQSLRNAWRDAFADVATISVPDNGDLFMQPADVMVSPANSFGYMDGGIDKAIVEQLGYDVEHQLQQTMLEHNQTTIAVGDSLLLDIAPIGDRPSWKYLIAAPTMYLPETLPPDSINAYLAFRAVLKHVIDHNRAHPQTPIISVACPGLGTGIGQMPPEQCARQMRQAFDEVYSGAS